MLLPEDRQLVATLGCCEVLPAAGPGACAVSRVADATETASASNPSFRRRVVMLWTLLIVLVVLWALGFFSGNALGGLIHLLLVVALVVLVFRLLTGRA